MAGILHVTTILCLLPLSPPRSKFHSSCCRHRRWLAPSGGDLGGYAAGLEEKAKESVLSERGADPII